MGLYASWFFVGGMDTCEGWVSANANMKWKNLFEEFGISEAIKKASAEYFFSVFLDN